MIMRLCEPDGWDDRDGLVGSADVFVVDYEGETCAHYSSTRDGTRAAARPTATRWWTRARTRTLSLIHI